MIPINGRPFLDYVLRAVSDAGFERVGIVLGTGHEELRAHYEDLRPSRIDVSFIEQREPLGTAHAVRQAEPFAAGEPFLVINGDNYYPAEVLTLVHGLQECGLVGFRRDTLSQGGNMTLAGTANCAHIELSAGGELIRLREKPGADYLDRLHAPVWLSMTCWRFTSSMFEAIRSIALSERGEYEIPDAVAYSIDALGERFRMVPSLATVLDLSTRGSIPAVESLLKDTAVDL
jgi:glucose-1-phosphate thymidylyltransferase